MCWYLHCLFILLCFNSLPTINCKKRSGRKKICYTEQFLSKYRTLQYRKVVVNLFSLWTKCIFFGLLWIHSRQVLPAWCQQLGCLVLWRHLNTQPKPDPQGSLDSLEILNFCSLPELIMSHHNHINGSQMSCTPMPVASWTQHAYIKRPPSTFITPSVFSQMVAPDPTYRVFSYIHSECFKHHPPRAFCDVQTLQTVWLNQVLVSLILCLPLLPFPCHF